MKNGGWLVGFIITMVIMSIIGIMTNNPKQPADAAKNKTAGIETAIEKGETWFRVTSAPIPIENSSLCAIPYEMPAGIPQVAIADLAEFTGGMSIDNRRFWEGRGEIQLTSVWPKGGNKAWVVSAFRADKY